MQTLFFYKIMKEKVKEYLPYVLIIIITLLIKAYIVTPINVVGTSMYPTLKNKDVMILNKYIYKFKDIKRYDIVVIKTKKEYIIKRVIALPGESIYSKNNQIYINGKKIKEKFSHSETKEFDEIKVPKNQYFVLGDNREVSIDSRYYGTFKKNEIKGKTKLIIFPFKRIGNQK